MGFFDIFKRRKVARQQEPAQKKRSYVRKVGEYNPRRPIVRTSNVAAAAGTKTAVVHRCAKALDITLTYCRKDRNYYVTKKEAIKIHTCLCDEA